MTIKQLEQALDMNRANIRYYEKEGLIAPVREKNGYRDYSEGDLAALRKVQLLRQLGLSVEDIREIQRGELPLARALDRQAGLLENRRMEAEQAQRICLALKQEGASYETLEAQRYLEQLKEAATWTEAKAHDQLPTVRHPWLRFFARFFDLALYSAAWTAVRLLLLRMGMEGAVVMDTILAYFTMLLLEPVLLSTWGYTPGKWIFGLEVRGGDGKRLTLGAAGYRTLLAMTWGMGLGVPLVNLYRLWKSHRTCDDGEVLFWEEGLSYTLRDEKPWRGLAFVAARAGVLFLCVVIGLQAQMPKHRGELTDLQLQENIRDAARFRGLSTGLVDPEYATVQGEGQIFLLERYGPVHWRVTEDPQGLLTQVEMWQESSDNPGFFHNDSTELGLMAFCLVGASEEYNLFTLPEAPWLDWLNTLNVRDDAMEAAGWRMEYRVDSQGMDIFDRFLVRQEEAADAWARWSFTMTRTDV